MSLGVMVLNIAVNVVQELVAQRRLRDFVSAAQPKVTVIREGKARNIDANNVVLGDMLVIGPGDQILVDGQLVGEGQVVVDESLLTGESARPTRGAGDQVFAGSYCVSGRAVCESQNVGDQRLVASLVADTQNSKDSLTPIEHIINRILRGLLVIVVIFSVLLIIRYFQMDVGLPIDDFINATNIIFSIAPAGLFFMILLTYTAGTADMAKIGALVHRARSVESLAQVNVICFARAGILTGTRVDLDTIEPPQDQDQLAESRIRQILGDFVRSTTVDNLATKAIADYFEGNQRTILEEAPLMSVYGWIALTFDDRDLKGIYVLGIEEALKPFIGKDGLPDTTEADKQPALKQIFARVGGVFNRSNGKHKNGAEQKTEPAQPGEEIENQEPESQVLEDASQQSDDGTKPSFFRRLANRTKHLFKRDGKETQESEIIKEESQQGIELLFAYSPDITPLYDESGVLYLPAGMIPLCRLRYFEHVRPEAVETIKKFSQTGVNIKILSPDNPDRTTAMLENAGMGEENGISMDAVSGTVLSTMDAGRFEQAVKTNTIFGDLSPHGAARVVQALRKDGDHVAVVGDGVNDVPALRQADLAISMHNSSQAAQGVSDIILLDDSPNILQLVMDKGQRIVNGLLDVLKLYLTQVFYITLLIVAVRLVAYGFPYQSVQASVISVITITIPAVGFSFWASPRVLHSAHLNRMLAFVVVPAAITIAAATMFVYYYFLTSTGEQFYAQLTVTYTLIGTGLLLVIFLKPPLRLLTGGAPLSHDWRILVLVLVLFAAFFVLVTIPLAQDYLKVGVLQKTENYLVVGFVVVVWALTLLFAWRIRPLRHFVPPVKD
jgi:magnesium-transporting ATPase (P-type)